MQPLIEKACKECGAVKPASEFHSKKTSKDGLNYSCKSCVKAYGAEWKKNNAEKINKATAAYKANNAEKIAAGKNAWAEKNKEAISLHRSTKSKENTLRAVKWAANNKERSLEIKTAWVNANREKARASSATYRLSNPERMSAFRKAWLAANPEKPRVYVQNRRARQRENGGRLSPGIVSKLFILQKGKCACCGKSLGDDYHVDHRVPLALGGKNSDDNVQLLTAICNLQKGSKPPEVFMRTRGLLL